MSVVVATILGILLVILVILGLLVLQPQFLVVWMARLFPDVLFFAETGREVVALTIDDAPHETTTPAILEVLEQYDAKATFFVLGEHIRGNERLLERIRDRGHELGNHLWSDQWSIKLSPEEFERQLIQVEERIGLEGQMKWSRPGSGWFNERMLKQLHEHGYRCVLASIYPHDVTFRNVELIATWVLSRVRPGAIIVLHDGSRDRIRTAKVLRLVLPELNRRGYEVTTVGGLMVRG